VRALEEARDQQRSPFAPGRAMGISRTRRERPSTARLPRARPRGRRGARGRERHSARSPGRGLLAHERRGERLVGVDHERKLEHAEAGARRVAVVASEPLAGGVHLLVEPAVVLHAGSVRGGRPEPGGAKGGPYRDRPLTASPATPTRLSSTASRIGNGSSPARTGRRPRRGSARPGRSSSAQTRHAAHPRGECL
jgi:hypothetical protein